MGKKKRGMGLCSWWFRLFCKVLYTVRSHGSMGQVQGIYISKEQSAE